MEINYCLLEWNVMAKDLITLLANLGDILPDNLYWLAIGYGVRGCSGDVHVAGSAMGFDVEVDDESGEEVVQRQDHKSVPAPVPPTPPLSLSLSLSPPLLPSSSLFSLFFFLVMPLVLPLRFLTPPHTLPTETPPPTLTQTNMNSKIHISAPEES
jgi:hypothetical protein